MFKFALILFFTLLTPLEVFSNSEYKLKGKIEENQSNIENSFYAQYNVTLNEKSFLYTFPVYSNKENNILELKIKPVLVDLPFEENKKFAQMNSFGKVIFEDGIYKLIIPKPPLISQDNLKIFIRGYVIDEFGNDLKHTDILNIISSGGQILKSEYELKSGLRENNFAFSRANLKVSFKL